MYFKGMMVFLNCFNKFMVLKACLGDMVRRWNTWMSLFLFGFRFGFCVLDLGFSLLFFRRGLYMLFACVQAKGRIVFVSGGRLERQVVSKHNAVRCGEYYWGGLYKGGALSNMKRLIRIDYGVTSVGGALSVGCSNFSYFGGRAPSFVVVLDPDTCYPAFNEARLMKVPCLGLIDSSMDFCDCSYPVCVNTGSFEVISSFGAICSNIVNFSKFFERAKFVDRVGIW